MAKQLNHYVCESYAIVDPTARKSTEAGAAVCSFAVRCNNSCTSKTTGEEVDRGILWSVTCFGKPAEIAMAYIRAGSHLLLSGSIEQSKYTRPGSNIEETRYQLVITSLDGLRILTPAVGSTSQVLQRVETDMESVLALKQSWKPEEVVELLKNSMAKVKPTNGKVQPQEKKPAVTAPIPSDNPANEAFV